MKVLIACEFSGIVRDAFAAKGHDAWSCDLLESEVPGKHFVGDVRIILDRQWDLIIAHPPCTYFSNAGLHYLKTQPGRELKLFESFNLVMDIYNSSELVCIENPIGWLNTHWRMPDQIISPHHFGEPELKKTCLWLKGLMPLIKGRQVSVEPKGYCIKSNGKKYNYYYHQSKNSKERSRTFPGIANAMAQQWSQLNS